MSQPLLQRAVLLHQQGRDADAERELRESLSQDPHDWYAHALLALTLSQLSRLKEATDEAATAVSLDAEQPFAHYAMARVMCERQRFKEAVDAIQTAIQLDSSDPDYFTLLGSIRIDQCNWPSALEAAEKALEINPEHTGATNLRALALTKLGRRDEATDALKGALERSPESALTHCGQGWALLHAGDHRRALEHFREALRLQPNQEWAQAGIVEALKSRYFIYRWLLRYSLWMSGLSSGARWSIVIGGYVIYRLLKNVADEDPHIAVYLRPVLILYLTFAVATWFAPTLFDLLLQLNRFGRLALPLPKRIVSIAAGVLLAAGAASAARYFLADDYRFFPIMWISVLLVIPLTSILTCERGWPRHVMIAVMCALALLGLLSVAVTWPAPEVWAESGGPEPLAVKLLIYFIYGILISQFVSMYLAGQRVRR